jgi:hypothetical protein
MMATRAPRRVLPERLLSFMPLARSHLATLMKAVTGRDAVGRVLDDCRRTRRLAFVGSTIERRLS